MRVIVLAGIVMAVAACAEDSAMVQADRAFVNAVANTDKSALDHLLDADFTWTNFDGKTANKSQVLAQLPKVAIASEQGAQRKEYSYGEMGDVQVNSGRAHVLRVWVKRTGGWKAIVYQEVMSLEAPPTFAPGTGKDCENPCKTVAYSPRNETERQVIGAYLKLETAAMAHNSAVFTTMVGDEFVAASSNSNKVYDKRGRLEDFAHSRMGGVAPTPLASAQLLTFGDAVLMRSEHRPDRGKPLHVTRVWVKRNGSWVETVSYQTSVKAGSTF